MVNRERQEMERKIREYFRELGQIFFPAKKRRGWGCLFLIYLAALVFTANDAWLYRTPIVRITEVQTKKDGVSESARGGKEQHYRQKLKGILLNGEKKGKSVILKNQYTYSNVLTQKFQKGDQILIGLNASSMSGTVKVLKRDVYLVGLAGGLLLFLVLVSGKSGILTTATLLGNALIFGVGFSQYLKGRDILLICNLMSVLFAAITLLILNGCHKRTWAALLSVLCVLGCIMGLFDLVSAHTEGFDYSAMEYLGSLDDPDHLFRAEIMLAGLGAIMDVAVTISSALGEIVQKKPEVSFGQLFRSGREIGYDIMGTMMNVLLFVFGCGLIPTFLIRMNNEVGFLTIVKLHIPYEICRFLIESIGIVLTIPVSILVASIFMKAGGRRKSG